MKKTNLNKKKILVRNLIWTGIIVTTIGLILTIVDAAVSKPWNWSIGISNPNNLWTPIGFWANIWHSLSTFTVQSNILVLVFFILALIDYIKKDKLRIFNRGWFKFAVTIYISITLIIFWAALFQPLITNTDFSKSIDVMNFLNTFLLHLFTPAIMITFYLVTSGSTRWTTKTTFAKALPIIISYMFVYLTYVLIKGTFVGQIKITDISRQVDYSYPYFFLNVKANLGIFFLYFFIILLLFIALFVAYYWYNNWKYDRNHEKTVSTKQATNKPITKNK